MKNPVTKLAAAAVIIIVVLTGIHYFGGSIPSTSVVFADVVERLHNARTMTYTANATTEIEIAFKKPGYMRTTMPGGFVTVIDWTQGKGLSTLPTRNQFIEMEMSNLPHDPAQQQFNVIEKLRTLPDRADTRECQSRSLYNRRIRILCHKDNCFPQCGSNLLPVREGSKSCLDHSNIYVLKVSIKFFHGYCSQTQQCSSCQHASFSRSFGLQLP